MRKPLFILIIIVLFVASGCNAKNEVELPATKAANEQPTEVNEKINETISETAVSTNAGEVSESSVKNDRTNEIKAPDFKLATLDGSEFMLSDFNGKVVMLNFWGTWCPPCRKEIPDLINLQNKYSKDGLEIVGITLSSGSASEIQKFVDDKNINYTVLTDMGNSETQQVTMQYSQAIGSQISSIPTTLVIDRDGYIVKGYLGPRSEEIFYNDLKEYL